jgi:hypothetical protein
MKYPKKALNYWDEGQKQRHLNWDLKRNSTQIPKRLGLVEWYKKGFWKRHFRKIRDKEEQRNFEGL